ncbi:TPA: N-6 DNA methylase [Escherichia coli]|nr:N-6 DNA methylase [Escherichia coli]
MNKLSMGVFRCSSVSEILKYIRAITSHRAPIRYGVEKVEGKSYDRLRREANQKAIDLLNSLVDGATLTDEQRQILAGYTGEGGIGGSVSEYYTPKPIAEGVWEIMKLYGADVGNTLEPSAGTGVFNETKPVGTVMTATEISSVSGRINQLLHPEDSVQISPFEQLAVSTPNDSFDHVVGNVPFGGRDNTRNIDKPYAEETDMGSYFMLRMLDKIKPGGFMCVIVPPSIVSGSNMKRLRLRLSRKAEFLGAHRLPTGTFDANGTSTVVDVVLMRKHPAEMAEKIPLVDESTLESANVLWPTFISGKWFEKDGRRFVHGTQEKGFQGRIEVRADGQIDNQALKAKLIHRFESRIDWSLLDMAEPSPTADVVGEGEMRLINGVWQKYAGGRWIEADAGKELKIDAASYGADSWKALQRNLTTTEGRLGMTFTQMANVRDKYTTSISDDMVQLVDWINSQPEKYRERLYRGAMIGRMLIEYQDMKAAGHSAEQIEQQRLSLVSRLQAEIDRFGNPGRGPIAKLSGSGARAWFAFRGAIKLDGTISDELTGKLVTHDSSASYDSTSYQDTLRYLYSDLTRDPIQLDDFRLAFTGELPASDDELLNLLASTPGIAVSPYGGIVPFARATSGDINEIVAPKQEFLATLPDGPVKNNVLNQLAAIEEKRIKTPAENIRFKLNSRWFDRSVILEFLQENGYPDLRYVQSVQLEGDEMVSDTYHGGDGLFVGHRYGVVQRKDKETGEIRYEWDRKSGENATGFPAQLEKYLNGARIGGKDSATANGYREQMALLEDQFNKWIKTHDRYDELVAKYNDVFNSNIPYEHSGDPLGLKGLSGKRQPFDYQNSEVRRLSEDGRGILGFGTGLGKTTTALALEAFNYENGRSTRTAYVVPKSVLENWYYEAKEFLSEEAFSNYLFVGLDVLMDGDQIRQVPVLDENGKPVLGTDGTPVTHEFRASDYEITTAQFGTIGIYSNKAEIKQAMDAASARIAAEREANLNHAVAALAQSWVTAIREAATTGKITPAIADVVNDGSKFMDAYQMDAVQLPSAYGQLSYRMTYNLVSMFSDLAILGLVDLNEVTPELLSMRKNHVEILHRINTVLSGRTDEEKQADADRINLALGNITEEEIAARNEKQEELSSIQGDASSIAQSLGLNYRVSTADLKMMYAPKFAAGEVFGLQEASGMKGVLFRAKDAIKAKFGARWLPAKAKNSDFPGNWWIIETKHNVADVLAVIQQYA